MIITPYGSQGRSANRMFSRALSHSILHNCSVRSAGRISIVPSEWGRSSPTTRRSSERELGLKVSFSESKTGTSHTASLQHRPQQRTVEGRCLVPGAPLPGPTLDLACPGLFFTGFWSFLLQYPFLSKCRHHARWLNQKFKHHHSSLGEL